MVVNAYSDQLASQRGFDRELICWSNFEILGCVVSFIVFKVGTQYERRMFGPYENENVQFQNAKSMFWVRVGMKNYIYHKMPFHCIKFLNTHTRTLAHRSTSVPTKSRICNWYLCEYLDYILYDDYTAHCHEYLSAQFSLCIWINFMVLHSLYFFLFLSLSLALSVWLSTSALRNEWACT